VARVLLQPGFPLTHCTNNSRAERGAKRARVDDAPATADPSPHAHSRIMIFMAPTVTLVLQQAQYIRVCNRRRVAYPDALPDAHGIRGPQVTSTMWFACVLMTGMSRCSLE
jgi:hypothetical protein